MMLGYGNGAVEFQPAGDHEVLLPSELPKALDEEIPLALERSIGKKLDSFSGAEKACILMSDSTRPSPSHLLLPPLVLRLRELDVKTIQAVFGLGTHRKMIEAEVSSLLKDCKSVCPSIRDVSIKQHDSSRCVHLGETSRGTPVEIFEDVMSSDLIIGTGNIEYHYYAGYSGGAKAMLPGVSSENSIVTNHMLMRDPAARSGNLNSPVRKDMEEAASIAGLDFILNVVLNSKKEVVRAVAGDFLQAHKEGAAVVDRMYECRVEQADIVVVSAGGSPKDINLYQAEKAIENAKDAVRPGGTLILLAECAEGLGNAAFERWVCDCKTPRECLERFGREYEFGGHKAAYIAEAAMNRELVIVSSLSAMQARRCFFKPSKSLEEAVASAMKKHGRNARMLIMPYGGLTLAKPA
jgi:nickel-dependent lactate racemase